MAAQEHDRLAWIEKRIPTLLDAVAELGELLAEVCEQRYYRFVYATFDAYVTTRWGIGRHRAYQLIASHETKVYLLTNGQQLLPENERQYRALGQLPLERRLLVWRAALEDADGERPVAADVAALVAADMARQTDEEQLATVQEYERTLVPAPRETHSANPVAKVERWCVALRKQVDEFPEAADEGRALEYAIRVYLAKLRQLT